MGLFDPLCIYHANCRDGFCAAWVFSRRFPNAEFFAGQYGKAPPDVTNREVVLVDFSYPREVLEKMADVAASIVVLDHHKTAEAALADIVRQNVRVLFDMNRSGAGLTWDYYFSDTGRPPLVSYVEDRDLWRHKLPDSEVINAYIATLPFTFEAWEQASQLMLSDQEAGVSLSQAKQWGQMAQQKTLQYVREVTKNTRSVNFEGLAVPCVNAPQVDISELLDGVCKQFPDAPFVVGWWQRGDGIFQYSLRSRGDFDVSEVAKKHGGGGHKAAAGFQKDHLIFGS